MKKHKAPGLSGLVAEMIQATRDIGTQWILDLCNGIVTEVCIPEELLEHAMEVVERIFECRIWQYIDTGDMQFGFVKGKGTTDTIFIVRQMPEKYRAKGKLYLALWIWKKLLIGSQEK